jgi:hypothetical protein
MIHYSQYWKSDHIIEEIPKIIINLDSDSDTDSEGDHDSEGETTDMYYHVISDVYILIIPNMDIIQNTPVQVKINNDDTLLHN